LWEDTLVVKQGYNLVLRMWYARYIGEDVLHRHILDHEDQGMMAHPQ
jgi:FtsP/CotA-like multicopper oxidase with cupredoxin domain